MARMASSIFVNCRPDASGRAVHTISFPTGADRASDDGEVAPAEGVGGYEARCVRLVCGAGVQVGRSWRRRVQRSLRRRMARSWGRVLVHGGQRGVAGDDVGTTDAGGPAREAVGHDTLAPATPRIRTAIGRLRRQRPTNESTNRLLLQYLSKRSESSRLPEILLQPDLGARLLADEGIRREQGGGP